MTNIFIDILKLQYFFFCDVGKLLFKKYQSNVKRLCFPKKCTLHTQSIYRKNPKVPFSKLNLVMNKFRKNITYQSVQAFNTADLEYVFFLFLSTKLNLQLITINY